MWWQFHTLEEKILRRRNQKRCQRCGLLHAKGLAECPHCAGIDELVLRRLLGQRQRQRLALARGMLIAGIVLVALIFWINR